MHLHFLKWALGVNRKASNIGTWGESGRYPLIFESINLTIKYITRLKAMKCNSLVSLAYKEQQDLQLDWYRGIEPILEFDPCYSKDHVSAFSTQHQHQKTANHNHNNLPPKENFMVHNGFVKRLSSSSQIIKPLKSRHFTPFVIMKSLKNRFREAWMQNKCSSPKMEFYNTVKHEFTKELYLDRINNYYDRANITRLRISAHRLEIEVGRRKKIVRSERFCKWCESNAGIKITECEDHFLYSCNLNSDLRQKTIIKVNNILNKAHSELDFMNLLHYHTKDVSTTKSNTFNTHGVRTLQHPHPVDDCTNKDCQTIANFVVNMISAFFENRKKFLKTVNDRNKSTQSVSEELSDSVNANAVPSRRPWKKCIPSSKIIASYPKFNLTIN